MKEFFGAIYKFCSDFQLEGSIAIIVVGILVSAVPMIIGSEESQTKAKKRLLWVLLGVAMLMGMFTIAADAGNRLKF